MPVGNYEHIYVSNFPVLKGDVFDQLSTDAKHLYRLCLAVVTGNTLIPNTYNTWISSYKI